jgi:C2H2-type zinc finger/Zinc finger, C2H2 type
VSGGGGRGGREGVVGVRDQAEAFEAAWLDEARYGGTMGETRCPGLLLEAGAAQSPAAGSTTAPYAIPAAGYERGFQAPPRAAAASVRAPAGVSVAVSDGVLHPAAASVFGGMNGNGVASHPDSGAINHSRASGGEGGFGRADETSSSSIGGGDGNGDGGGDGDGAKSPLANISSNLVCTICGAKFSRPCKLRWHRQSMHAHAGKAHKCECCDQSFPSVVELRRHAATHSAPRPQCPQCGLRFRLPSALDLHIAVSHDRERPFKCDLCDAAFARKSAMRRHLKSVHQRERHFCGDCGASYSQPFDLKRHRIRTGHVGGGSDADVAGDRTLGGGGRGSDDGVGNNGMATRRRVDGGAGVS